MIAALFVETGGPYFGLPNVDPWDIQRDARNYHGPHAVVAHPPCERWGRYWSGGPNAHGKFKKGDDGGCFEAALRAVRLFGGVLEHPEATHAWDAFGLPRPLVHGGWSQTHRNEFVCQVEQGKYGHPARKKTWLFCVPGRQKTPPPLRWGPSTGTRMDEGFHSSEERRLARARGVRPIKRLSRAQRIHTPLEFRDALIAIAEGCR